MEVVLDRYTVSALWGRLWDFPFAIILYCHEYRMVGRWPFHIQHRHTARPRSRRVGDWRGFR